VRPSSRSRRRRRLRSTTVFPKRGTTVPKRGDPPGDWAVKTSRRGPRRRIPEPRRVRISLPRWIRLLRGSRSPSVVGSPERGGGMNGLLRSHLHGETLPALAPTTIERLATPSGLHSGPKAMLVQPLPVSWPVRRFHPVPPGSRDLPMGHEERGKLPEIRPASQGEMCRLTFAGRGG